MVKEKPNLHVAHSGMGSGDGVDPETTGGDDGGGNDALYTAQEIIDAFPKGHLHRVTAWWVAAQLFFCKNFQTSSSCWKSQSFRLR